MPNFCHKVGDGTLGPGPAKQPEIRIIARAGKPAIIGRFFVLIVENDMDLIGGQFLQLSIPGVGEAPISISDFTDEYLDMTIRKVGKLTDGIFELKAGDKMFVRGPYGNGFNLNEYKGKNLIIVAGGTGLAPVKNVVNYFYNNMDLVESFTLIVGFKTPKDILFENEIK